ncbi:MAG: MBL fold metallo-hydrolase, partial [Zetaproteobacteria bacterium]
MDWLQEVADALAQAQAIPCGPMRITPLWADSLGAKSLAVRVETPDIRLLIDPGAAVMQKSFPLPEDEKERLKRFALERIARAAEGCEAVFISHYHHDHYADPALFPRIYQGKRLFIKDPNQWINRSQHGRARAFLLALAGGAGLPEATPSPAAFPRPTFPLADAEDFGEYDPRRRALLRQGLRRFKRLSRMWRSQPWVKEGRIGSADVRFADGREFRFGRTAIRFSPPLFHGVEYARVGWVIACRVECEGKCFLFTSDVQGPVIEDDRCWIIDQRPDLLILDGPPTYLLGRILNRINLARAERNLC